MGRRSAYLLLVATLIIATFPSTIHSQRSSHCPASSCVSCLQRCWDQSSDARAIVRELGQVLDTHLGHGGSSSSSSPSASSSAGAGGAVAASASHTMASASGAVCTSPEATAAFVRAVRNIVRSHRAAIGVSRIWGLGLHASSAPFWLGYYACVRSSQSRGQCHRASQSTNHGFLLLECPGARRLCKWDVGEVDEGYAGRGGGGGGRAFIAAVQRCLSDEGGGAGGGAGGGGARARARRASVGRSPVKSERCCRCCR
jgi:hypothetical protein